VYYLIGLTRRRSLFPVPLVIPILVALHVAGPFILRLCEQFCFSSLLLLLRWCPLPKECVSLLYFLFAFVFSFIFAIPTYLLPHFTFCVPCHFISSFVNCPKCSSVFVANPKYHFFFFFFHTHLQFYISILAQEQLNVTLF